MRQNQQGQSFVGDLPSTLQGPQALLIGLSIFLLNFGLKILFLDSQAIANDEPFTLFWAQKSLSEIWELAKNENNPPLHFVIQHFWLKWFGWSVASIRMPSLIFSSLSAMLIFRAGNRHFGLFAGIVAAILLSFSTEHVYYSHEARTYSLLCLLTILIIDQYLELVASANKWKHYLLLCIFNVLLIYSHFLGVWLLLTQILFWPLMPNRKRTFIGLLLTFLGVGLAYLPNIYAFYLRLQSVASVPTWVPAPHLTQLYGHINIFLNGAFGTLGIAIPLIFGFVWATIGKKSRRDTFDKIKKHRRIIIITLLFCLIYGGIYIQSLLFTPAFIPRYLVFTSIPFFLAVGAWLNFLIEGLRLRLGILGLVSIALLVGFQLDPPNRRDLKGLTSFIESERGNNAPLIICPNYFDKAYLFHADLKRFQRYENFESGCQSDRIYALNGMNSLPKGLIESNTKLILLDADAAFVYPENGFLEGLSKHYSKVEKTHFEEIFDVYVFER